MSAFSSLILTQLTVPPGDLIYYVVLVFAVASALQSAFNHWRISEFPQARRAFVGLGILLVAQVVMFIFSGLGWQQIVDLKLILPPMDRAYILFGIIWITWLYGFPEPSRAADAAATLLSLLVVTALGLSLLTWQPQIATTSYNLTADDWYWQVASLAVGLLGIVILFIRRPDGMWNGVVLLTLGVLGHTGHLFFPVDGNYSGIVRLAYMAAYPILLTLPQRFSIISVAPAQEAAATPAKQETGTQERRRYSTDPKTFHAMLALAAESNPTKVSQAITRAIAQTMLSDLCFMVYLTDNNNQIVIAGGYDLIREDTLEGGSLKKSSIPMLANSLQRGRPLRMPSSSTSADIKGLGDVLGLANPGHLLSVPILTPEKEALGGLLLLSPYSDRTWTAEDQAYLSNIATALVPIIKRSQKTSKLETQSDHARAQIVELDKRVQELTSQLEEARTQTKTSSGVELESLRVAQEESLRIIEQLQLENGELRSGRNIQPSSTPTDVEEELRQALQEVARLQNQVMEANIKTTEIEKSNVAVKSTEQAEVIASISQELRQPLSSIVGYTDLLLGESVGILGALQRKFVERVKNSTERIRSLTDDLIQITTLETELNDLKTESVDLNSIIDNAMSYTSTQVREKNISIHLELPKTLLPIQADREALQQILIHLLQNAGAATPFEGTIKLRVETQTEEDNDFILIQVTDSGGGIAAEDLPRVFTRLYRAENVLIQGLGDTGVGLSIAKKLTEAQHGRIWVESEQGVGSAFSVLLPIAGAAMLEKQDKEKVYKP
ncbi:MAG: hypothetical protein HY864_18335 [Chloroflexi bacterium]|nr:hypothetical protein [Chloroflexota bacterium]